MATERFVALGVARARTPWFGEVARWANSGALALDFVKAMSLDEVRARLDSGRPFSALLVDGELPGVDRDLIEQARSSGCAVLVVTSSTARDWSNVGAATTLPADFGRNDLEAALVEHATPIGAADDVPGQPAVSEHNGGFRGRTIAVTGPGGTGRSVVSIALAQGFGSDVAHADSVVLADLALHADHAMLHDARDVIPGLLELVDAHRAGAPSPAEVRGLTFDIVDRRYHLLLGLRRHRDWTALRPRALRASIDGLRQAFTLVVADVDDDLEGEENTGSADVEDRNMLARMTLAVADVVVVVGTSGVKGVHSLLRVVRDCIGAGVAPERVVIVVNRAPKRGLARSETARTIGELLDASHPGASILSPVFLPDRKGLDDVLRDGAPMPSALVEPVVHAVRSRLDALDAPPPASHDDPVPVAVGSLPVWHEESAG